MKLPLFIARRYLFSPKKQNVINIISIISVAGIAVGSAALVVVLSVFNGIDLLLDEAAGSFTPDVTLSPARGKFAPVDTALERRIAREERVLHYQVVAEDVAIARHGEHVTPVIVKGVGEEYDRHENLSAAIIRGHFATRENEKNAAILGVGVASALRARLGTSSPVTLYYPGGGGFLSSLSSDRVYPVGIFATRQELDARYLVTGIDLARRLFNATGSFSKIEIALRDPGQMKAFKESFPVDDRYKLEDKYDLNASFYAMMRSEKLVIFLLLFFILGVASFNIVASISMLIIDKKEDLSVYRALGMSRERIASIFRVEGLMITASGAAAGFLAGITLCFLQERFGLVSLGEGSYLVEAYPVKIAWDEVLAIMLVVLATGAAASHFPVRYLTRKFVKK
ncbi:MAG: FtsX-like permease family protein [Odoribacteraceae bacterium]|jgi:lipoprotein-releasing system permease protein|nr:FtsX-like permease family protein [Odoribacteraceae bacterium]